MSKGIGKLSLLVFLPMIAALFLFFSDAQDCFAMQTTRVVVVKKIRHPKPYVAKRSYVVKRAYVAKRAYVVKRPVVKKAYVVKRTYVVKKVAYHRPPKRITKRRAPYRYRRISLYNRNNRPMTISLSTPQHSLDQRRGIMTAGLISS
ncbi:MAG: hypothetical protein HQK59_12545 [Deltaproteobacteria bacterium]|nr:hypothetical protein [Deltaproteobacteria bacterium]